MRSTLRLVACLVMLWAATVRMEAHAQPLPAEVEAALARAKLPREAVTVVVADAEGRLPPRVWHRADAPVNPASIAKLATTFAALDLLGPAYAWVTPVYIDGPVRDGVLQGNLYLKGQGDPRLVMERLWQLMRRVQGLGIRRITGDIVLDRSAFELAAQDPAAFDGEPLRPYNAAPDALLVNYRAIVLNFTPNGDGVRVQMEPPQAGVQVPEKVPMAAGECGDWRAALRADFRDPARIRFDGAYPASCGTRLWPVGAPEPAGHAIRAVAGMWQEVGGQLGGTVRDGRVPAGLKPVLETVSPALSEVIRDRKLPGSHFRGEANLLIMPNLDAANIAYQFIKVLADALPVGPILLGTAKPAHVLTTSVTARGVVNMTALAVVEAQASFR